MVATISGNLAIFVVAAADAASSGTPTMPPTGPSLFDVLFPLTALAIIAVVVPAALMSLNWFLSRWAMGGRNDNAGRNQPVEAGLTVVVGGAGERFDIKFYLIAMLFLVFDIEVAFLYPWAIQFSKGGWEMVALLAVFLVMLEAVYLYLYKKGALDWDK